MTAFTDGANDRASRFASLVRPTVIACVTMLAFVAALIPARDIRLGWSPGFFAGYATLTTVSEALLAAVLLAWARLSGNRQLRWLGVTYGLTALLLGANVGLLYAVEHGVHPFGVRNSAWLYLFFHAAWALGVLLATFPAIVAGWSPFRLAAAALASVVALHVSPVPRYVLLVDAAGRFTGVQYALTALVVALTVVAIVRIFRAPLTPERELDGWLLVAALALIGDVTLGDLSLVRFSVGTYAARVLGCVSGVAVLAGVFRGFVRMTVRSAALERYARMVDGLPAVAFITDAQMRCDYVNRAWTELTGQSETDACGAGWRRAVHPDDLPARSIFEGRSGSEVIEREVRFRDRDGIYRVHLARYARFDDGRRTAPRWIGTATNIDSERRLVEALRSVFLPAYLPKVDGLSFEAVYRPGPGARDVGGDWYDAFVLPSGIVAFTIGDVCGHGIDAATEMVRLREMLRGTLIATAHGPAEALAATNRVACARNTIASALIALYDPARGTMRMASAGHPAPILVRRGRTRLTTRSGVVLGALDDSRYTDTTIVLAGGDRMAFYTDGVLEANREPIEGENRLLRELQALDGRRLEDVVAALFDGPQTDDATLVVATHTAPALPTVFGDQRSSQGGWPHSQATSISSS